MAQIYGEVILNDLNRLRSHPSLNDDPSLCATHTLLVMLASSTSGDQHLFIVTMCRPPPHQDWGRARTAGNRFARDDKEPGQPGRSNYPENGLVKPPKRDSRAFSPASMLGGKAPLRLAAQKSRLHAQLVPMRSAPAYFLCNWGV